MNMTPPTPQHFGAITKPAYFNQDNFDLLVRRTKSLQYNMALFSSQYSNKMHLLSHFLTSRSVEHERMMSSTYLGQITPLKELFEPTPLLEEIEEMKECVRSIEIAVHTTGQQVHQWFRQVGQLILKGEYRSVHNLLLNVRRELRDTEQEVTQTCDEMMNHLTNLKRIAKNPEAMAFLAFSSEFLA